MVSALDRRLMDAEVTRAARDRPNNPTALDQFFRARSTMDRAITLGISPAPRRCWRAR